MQKLWRFINKNLEDFNYYDICNISLHLLRCWGLNIIAQLAIFAMLLNIITHNLGRLQLLWLWMLLQWQLLWNHNYCANNNYKDGHCISQEIQIPFYVNPSITSFFNEKFWENWRTRLRDCFQQIHTVYCIAVLRIRIQRIRILLPDPDP